MFKDEHHIINRKREWELRPEAYRIRAVKSLRPVIPRVIHNAIHAHTPPVPLLGYETLVQVQKNFRPTSDTLETLDLLCDSIVEAGRHPRAHPIERELGELTIEALQLQVPFLREGLGEVPVIEDYTDLRVVVV